MATTEAGKQARREYYRQWRRNNPESIAASQEKYWSKKGEEITRAGIEPGRKGKGMNIRKLKDELIKIGNEYAAEYARACEASRIAYLAGLPAGSVTPGARELITEEEVEAFDAFAQELKARALTLIDDALAEIDALKAAAPSEEAARVISLLAARSALSADDLAPLYAAYGENYQANAALRDIAVRNGVYDGGEHRLDVLARELTGIRPSFERMSAVNARSGARPGVISMQNAMIEANIPE